VYLLIHPRLSCISEGRQSNKTIGKGFETMTKLRLSKFSSEESMHTFDSKATLAGRGRKKSNSFDAQKNRRVALRAVLILSLVAASAICATLAYTQLQGTEENVGIQTYFSIALSATKGAKSITERKFQGSEVMSTLLSQILPDASNWPFIEVDGYIQIAEKVATLSSSTTQSLMVILDPADARLWENHTMEVYKTQERPEGTGYSDFGFGIWKPDKAENKTNEDGRLHDITGENNWEGKRDIMAVLMMHNIPAASSHLLNLYSRKDRGSHIDSISDCVEANEDTTKSPSCPAVTDMLELVVRLSSIGSRALLMFA
jgi:hypothetical protein